MHSECIIKAENWNSVYFFRYLQTDGRYIHIQRIYCVKSRPHSVCVAGVWPVKNWLGQKYVPVQCLCLSLQWCRHGGGGGNKRDNLPPPPPPTSDQTPREIDADLRRFSCREKWAKVYSICFHVLHAPMLRRTFFGLTITKKEVLEVVEGVTLVGPL